MVVAGADLMNGTAIYDIKPYLPYTDCHTDATNGFAEEKRDFKLEVRVGSADVGEETQYDYVSTRDIPRDVWKQIVAILEEDPRPAYHDDCDRVYGLTFAGWNVHFRVDAEVLYVIDITKL